MTPSEQARWKKENNQKMTRIEKIIYLRTTKGLGLKEATDYLIGTGNNFDGYWQENHEP